MSVASEIAKRFGNRQCVECVTALVSKLPGPVLEIDVTSLISYKRADMVHATLVMSESISRTGRHFGFLHDGKVYDNLHHEGVLESEWISNFLFFNKVTGRECAVAAANVHRLTATQFLQRQK